MIGRSYLITAGLITAGLITAGLITAGLITAGLITADHCRSCLITAGLITAGLITAGLCMIFLLVGMSMKHNTVVSLIYVRRAALHQLMQNFVMSIFPSESP